MSQKIKTLTAALMVVVIVVFIAALGIKLLRNAAENALENKIAQIGEGENAGILKKLNSEWVLPDNYSLEIIDADGLVMEWMKGDEASEKAILQLHGGAYTRSLADNGATYRRSAAQYVNISGASVLTPDYRVAPEYPYPCALEDALSAYEWLLEQGYEPESIIIAGDSAGGGLTLALTLYLRDNNLPMPAAVITMSPWTNLVYRRYTPPYAAGNDAGDPYISPYYGKYEEFPPMLMQVGGDEVLLDDTLGVAEKAAGEGVKITQTTYPGMFHVFQMLYPELQSACDAWDEVRQFISGIFEN